MVRSRVQLSRGSVTSQSHRGQIDGSRLGSQIAVCAGARQKGREMIFSVQWRTES